MANKLPYLCPSCGGQLKVIGLQCNRCETQVSGVFDLPVLARLSTDDHKFIVDFVKSGGNIKDMVRQLGLSYPTVRNMLDEIILKIKNYEQD
ncbi:MAG: DUF2089 domain-containing protein [Prevotellaceae bacterium]|jgi:hypothetical protein|nr:DUF2089 domain-containing protein [Prevotellaceae bacterium]